MMSSDEEDTSILRRSRDRRYRWRRSSSPPPPPAIHVIPPPTTSSDHSLPSGIGISMGLLHNFRKPNPKVLSFLLQALIMILVITVFFLFMGLAAIFLLHICIVGRTLHRVRNRSPTIGGGPPISHFAYSFQDDFDLGTTGLSLLDIQKLPSFDYSTMVVELGGSARDCVVCLEGFKEDERFRILPTCKHAFHASCIDAWLLKSSACPICRGVVDLELE